MTKLQETILINLVHENNVDIFTALNVVKLNAEYNNAIEWVFENVKGSDARESEIATIDNEYDELETRILVSNGYTDLDYPYYKDRNDLVLNKEVL